MSARPQEFLSARTVSATRSERVDTGPLDRLMARPLPELWSQRMARALARGWERGLRWISDKRTMPLLGMKKRRLQVTETVQLGEKRFVAILRVDQSQFLIGSSATGVALLACLAEDAAPESFQTVFAASQRKEGSE